MSHLNQVIYTDKQKRLWKGWERKLERGPTTMLKNQKSLRNKVEFSQIKIIIMMVQFKDEYS